MRTYRTEIEFSQIHDGLVAYENEYGTDPPTANNQDVVKILKGDNPYKTEFIYLSLWELSPKGEIIDAWGTALRISYAAKQSPLVQSAGPDRAWGTQDDLTAQ